PDCRGLWYDGEHFWSAEAKESLGSIFKFDHQGQVIDEWSEPAFSGWGVAVVSDDASGVDEPGAPPGGLLGRVSTRPNPSSSNCRIVFHLSRPTSVSVTIFDSAGRRIERLRDGVLPAGNHEIPWSADGLPNGLYHYRIQAGGEEARGKLLQLD
ncbi:MAG: T9SS type A sorting domain-containing protein, partial [Candidatus Eisenbacteria bacterium]|nr:T9SS type A sorting domain-containing protein [Candidatus Eisenbacteria bacterium]